MGECLAKNMVKEAIFQKNFLNQLMRECLAKNMIKVEIFSYFFYLDQITQEYTMGRNVVKFNPILPGLLNTLQTRGGRILPPPNSLVFCPRSIKFGM